MNNYEEYLESRENKSKFSFKIWNQAKPLHIILLAVLVLIGNQIYQNNKDNQFVWIIVGGLGVLYLFSLTKKDGGLKQLPRHIAEQIALNDLKREIGVDGSYPIGTEINPLAYFKDQSWDAGDGSGMKLFKYNIGFKIKEPSKPEREIIYQMNPFSGESKGIVEAPLGFSGENIKDTQMIFPEKWIKEEKKE